MNTVLYAKELPSSIIELINEFTKNMELLDLNINDNYEFNGYITLAKLHIYLNGEITVTRLQPDLFKAIIYAPNGQITINGKITKIFDNTWRCNECCRKAIIVEYSYLGSYLGRKNSNHQHAVCGNGEAGG